MGGEGHDTVFFVRWRRPSSGSSRIPATPRSLEARAVRADLPSPPVLVAFPPGPDRESVLAALDGLEVEEVVDHWTGCTGDGRTGGVVVVSASISCEEQMALVDRLTDLPGDWTILLVRRGEGGAWEAVPLSPGFPTPLAAAARGEGGGVGLRAFMRSVARARHDINNPLTSALAEVQLLLLDGNDDPMIIESLNLVQEQLRRIRDLVIDLTRFRPPAG